MKSTQKPPRKRPNTTAEDDEPPKKKKKTEKKAHKRKADSSTFKIPDKAKSYRDATGKKKKRKSTKTSKRVKHIKRNAKKCKICGQMKNNPDLVYQGHPQYAVEEQTALTDEYLVLYSDGTLMERPQINITGFSIYDQEGHLCPPDSSVVLNNPKIYISGYLNPICSDLLHIDEQSVPVKDIGPFRQWSISAFGGRNKNCITISTVCADYNLQNPSEQYKPIMESHFEKNRISEVVTNFVQRYYHLKPTYENLLRNVRCHFIHELNNKRITEKLLHKHAYFVCDQVRNLTANDGNLINLPCMKKLIKSAGIHLEKAKKQPVIKIDKKIKPKSWTKATTTPLVRKAFEKFFSKQLDKTNPKLDSERCGICKICQLRDCGECNACRGMAKFGGDGRTKKTCINRICPHAVTKQAEEPDNNTTRKYQKGDYYMYDDYMKLKWIGEPVQRDRRRIYYESAEINDERLRKGDYVMLRMLHPHIPSLVARVAYIWKEVYFHPGEGFFHAEVFIKSTHTVLGEVGDPREVFLHNRCLHGVPFSGLLRKACVEKRDTLSDSSNSNEYLEEDPMDDDGRTYFYSKFYDRFKARFQDLPMDPSCPNELRAHKYCPSCERKSLHEDKIIPALIGDPIPKSPILPANRTEWSTIRCRGYDYKKGCAVFLRWDNFKLKNRINKRLHQRKLELKQKKMKLRNVGSTQKATQYSLKKRSTNKNSSIPTTLHSKNKSSTLKTQQLKNKASSKKSLAPKYIVTRKILSVEKITDPKNKNYSKTLKSMKARLDKKINQENILKNKILKQKQNSKISERVKQNQKSTEKILQQENKMATANVIKSKQKLKQKNKMASANLIKLKKKKTSQKILELKELITNVIKSKKKLTKILNLIDKLLKQKRKKFSGKKEEKQKKKISTEEKLKQDKNKRTSQNKGKINYVQNKQKQENSAKNHITYQMKHKLIQKISPDKNNIKSRKEPQTKTKIVTQRTLKQNNKKCGEKILKHKNEMSIGKVIKSKTKRSSQRIYFQNLLTQKNKKSSDSKKTLIQEYSSENNIAKPKKSKPKDKFTTQKRIKQENSSNNKSSTQENPNQIDKLNTQKKLKQENILKNQSAATNKSKPKHKLSTKLKDKSKRAETTQKEQKQKDSSKNKYAVPNKSMPSNKFTAPKTLKQDNNPKNTNKNKSKPKDKLTIQQQLKHQESFKSKSAGPNKPKAKGRRTQKKLKQVDENVYTEYHRKRFENIRGSNSNTREPFSIGYIEAVSTTGYGEFLPPQDYYLTVKIMYRPENTRHRYPHREDQNLVYWSDDLRHVPFSAVAGPCHLLYAKNVPEGKSLQEWLDEDPNRFYFKRAYNRAAMRVEKVPSHATAVGKIEHARAGKDTSETTSDCKADKVRPLRTLDIFAGCGGLSEGLHRAGVSQCRWAIENSEIDALAYSRNNRKCTVFADDCNALLRDVMSGAKYRGGVKLPMRGDVEMLCGGPPCQGFSGMNRFTFRDASNFQNSLIATFLSYCDYYRPKYIILENVRNFASFKRGMVLKLTMRALLDMSYQCTFGVLQAGQYGVPQARRRFILIAVAPGHVLPFFPEPTHSFSPNTGALTVKIDNKKFRNNLRWELRAPRRTVTIRDAISDLPKISNGADGIQMKYRFKPLSHFQRTARRYKPKLRDHIIKETAPLLQARIDRIPKVAGADWRDLPNISVELSDGTKCNVLQYNYDDIRNGRSSTGALRGVCSCASGARCLPQSKQMNTLIPWFLPHTANRHAQWAGVYGRLSWGGFFSTIITNPDPNGKQGRVLHPTEARVVSVRECARAQGFPDHYVFCGTVQDKYRQIGNAVPPPLGEALGREIKKSLLGIHPI